MDKLFKVSQQTFWQILGKIVTSVTTFIFLGIVARNYGEAGTGVFTLALTYLAIFYLLADFGFNAHLLKSFHSYGQEGQTLELRKLLGTRIILAGTLFSFALGTLPFWPFTTEPFANAVLFGSLAIFGSAIFVTSNLVFQAKLRYEYSVIASSAGTLGSLGLVAWFSDLNLPLSSIMLAHLIGWIVIANVALLLVKKFITTVSPIFDKRYSLNLIKSSWPIAATLALNVVYFRADTFILSYFKTATEVGIYNIAYSVFQSALVLPTFIMNAYYPIMLESLTQHPQKFSRQLKFTAFSLSGLAFVGVIFTYLLGPLLIELLTGGGFNGATEVLNILSLGFPAYFLSALLMWLMVIKKQYKLLLIIYSVGLVFNIVLNWLYIPQYSFYASAWITVGSEYSILFLQLVSLKVK